MNDFLHGMAIRLACASLPVRKVYADVLDNEWPISWSTRRVKNNKTYLNGTMTFRRVSDAVGYDYANAAAAVTMVGDGFTETFTTKNIGVTDTSLGKLVYIRCTLSGTIFILALLVIETPGFEGAVEFDKTGTYYAFLNSSYVNVEISNADVQFELTAPKLIGYMYNDVGPLPELPEWDKDKYPYVLVGQAKEDSDAGYVKQGDYVLEFTEWKPTVSTTAKPAYFYIRRSDNDYVFDGSKWVSTILWNSDFLYPVWSNCDVYYSGSDENLDGTIYLAASEPVPVYE